MDTDQNITLLKTILENLDHPEKLNDHPWVKRQFMAEFRRSNPDWRDRPAGSQLVEAVFRIFEKLKPERPPRQGLRLDTRWGEFGLLAAMYFAPYRFGIPTPATLRAAWQEIDRAILLFVFGTPADIPLEDRQRYRLVGGEPEIAANSTISDWHRKGLEHLAGVIIHYEGSLATRKSSTSKRKNQVQVVFKTVLFCLLAVLLVGVAWTGYSAWRITQRLRSVEENSQTLLELSRSATEPAQLDKAGQTVASLRADLQELETESSGFLRLAPYFAWLPVYGGDLSQAPQLLEMGKQLSIAGDEVFRAAAPVIAAMKEKGTSGGILDLLGGLQDDGTRLLAAQSALAQARTARQNIQTEKLSTRFQSILIDRIDPLLSSMQGAFPVDDVLAMARLAPRLLGAIGNGPQTYLIMIQNEDELRPTGGFLSAVGKMVLENGRLNELSFESSELVDDLSKPYPQAPWQLDEYMRAEILLLRDANWFTDFPTTVKWVRFLYAYTRPQAVNGVIALDQHVIVELLRQVGPLQVEGASEPVSSENVLTYMRTAKEQKPPEGISAKNWDRKQFISRLADPLMKKLMAGDSKLMQKVSGVLIRLLDEKHIMLQSDDPEMNALLRQKNWDGAVKPPANSDFLMLVDSNVGFNKTSAVVDESLKYQLDLTNLENPTAQVTVSQANKAAGSDACLQLRGLSESDAQKDYRINDCYWSYLRLYTPAGSVLTASTPHIIPAGWALREQEIPARTDTLEEDIQGIQAFGTLLVVPESQALDTTFQYRLPPWVISRGEQESHWIYRLKAQKQPGTLAIPLTIQIRLPVDMAVFSPMNGLTKTTDGWEYTTNLQRDGTLEIEFGPAW
ncbi:MAG: DUF4012 domain-containing protein [Leptolinea sp.]|jgi:hypothetical protein|nr:DUF4012 domain-containing protein [Leptolinea sp.]